MWAYVVQPADVRSGSRPAKREEHTKGSDFRIFPCGYVWGGSVNPKVVIFEYSLVGMRGG